MKISVFIKQPGKRPYHAYIENSLDELQKTVGGYIEHVAITTDFGIICNEEGRLLNLPYNCNCLGMDFCGTLVFIGNGEEDFCNAPMDRNTFHQLYNFLFKEV